MAFNKTVTFQLSEFEIGNDVAVSLIQLDTKSTLIESRNVLDDTFQYFTAPFESFNSIEVDQNFKLISMSQSPNGDD